MSGHRHLTFFERHGDHLDLTCPYAVEVVQAAPGINNRNCVPWSRLFLMDPDGPHGPDTVRNLSARTRHLLQPGQILLLPPDRLYGFQFSPGMRMVAVHFRLEWARGCDVFGGRTACEIIPDHADLIRQVYQTLASSATLAGATTLRGLILQVAGLLVRDVPSMSAAMHEALVHIDTHGRADLSLDELAVHTRLSREHFSREFKRQVGVAPKAYMHRRLIQAAGAHLLAGTKVKDVAKALAFTNEFYFSRFFKRHTGVAPSVFAASL